jgi:hypothetical protein
MTQDINHFTIETTPWDGNIPISVSMFKSYSLLRGTGAKNGNS